MTADKSGADPLEESECNARSKPAVAQLILVWAAGFATLTVIVLLMMARADGRVPDDAYIFFRYARNIADGHGWTYNLGRETCNGVTSPLWAVLLVAAYLVRHGMESNAWMLYSLCLAGAGALTFATLRSAGRQMAGVAAAILIVLNPILLGVRGMESALLLLFVAAVLHVVLVRRRDFAGGLLGGLLVLVRPEGALLLVIVAAIRWWRGRRIPWKLGVGAVLPIIPWVAFSVYEFGSPISGSLAAKMAQGTSGFFGPWYDFFRHARAVVVNPWSLALLLVGLVGLFIGVRGRRARDYTVALGAFVALHVLLYGLVVRPPAYPWYYALEYFALTVFCGLALESGADFAAARLPTPTSLLGRIGVFGIGLTLLGGLSVAGQSKSSTYEGYKDAARWIRSNAPRNASVSATEIGVLGWNVDHPIVDYLGLLSLTSAEEVSRGDLRSWLDREEPDYYVQHVPGWAMETPAASADWFAKAYRPVFQSDVQGWSHVRVFKRVKRRGAAQRSDELVLLSPTVVRALEEAGATVGPDEKVAFNALLAEYLSSVELQVRLEQNEGTDLVALLDCAIAGDTGRLAPYSPTLRRLRAQLGHQRVVSPLAPLR